MSDMKFSLPGRETVTLTSQTIDKLILAKDGDAALLYLYIIKTDGKSSSAETAAAMGKSPDWIAEKMGVLSWLGLVNMDKGAGALAEAPAEAPAELFEDKPHRRLTVVEMKRELESGSVFYALVEEVQRSLGKIISPDDLLRLFGIYDVLRMAPEVILQLVTHCITESRGRSGGRMPSMRYIEKAAYTWEREGIFSLDKAEEYLKALDVKKSARWEMRNAMQIRDREFSETEKRYVDNWIAMGFSAGAIAIAYDRTVVKTGKLSWQYMNSIINSWHSKGLHAPQEILEKDTRPDSSGPLDSKKAPGQKFGPADQEEIERMRRLLNKIKED